ncbi:MAG: N-acetyl-gamma-glutamyl-phosphate reductase [Clostridiales bacterium]|nr:N-acetyl-gamma-glutamyl-phosphate reductase [Clostridiales bacterium]
MALTVFIDGKEGTTGLRIFERLATRPDLTMLTLPEEKRKDPAARKEAIHAADIAVLCLPDAAAKESVALAEGSKARILDTSTAHRIASGWSYGFAELSAAHRQGIIEGSRVAVPGCHASGFISLVTPLTATGLLPADTALTCFSLTGYSGGGKKMIAQYEGADRTPDLDSPRPYGLTQAHKHLPEMTHVPGLKVQPIFAPIVADFYSGMEVTVPLFGSQLRCAHPVEEVTACLKAHYEGSPIVKVLGPDEVAAFSGFIPSNALSGKDGMQLMVTGNDERLQIVSLFDNLGKGSSGAALQCLNLMTGVEETLGLNL